MIATQGFQLWQFCVKEEGDVAKKRLKLMEEERVNHLNEVIWQRVIFFQTVGGGGYAKSDQKQLVGVGVSK